MGGQGDRILSGDDRAPTHRFQEQSRHSVDAPSVWAADWRHLHDFPVDQLDAVVLGEDAGVAHPVVVVHRESVPQDLDGHASPFPDQLAR